MTAAASINFTGDSSSREIFLRRGNICDTLGHGRFDRKWRNFTYPTYIRRLRSMNPVGISQRCLVLAKLERLGYHTLKKV